MAKEATKEAVIETQRPYNPMEDLIPVTLPRATGNEQNFELVSLNGKTWQIMKGVTVQIPLPVYEVLMESIRQENKLRDWNDEHQQKQ